MDKNQNENILLKIIANDNGSYTFEARKGTNVNELAFCIAALAKVLERDNVVDNADIFVANVVTYLHDSQYDEPEVEEVPDETD